jgi:hypothetical protein
MQSALALILTQHLQARVVMRLARLRQLRDQDRAQDQAQDQAQDRGRRLEARDQDGRLALFMLLVSTRSHLVRLR